MKAGEPGTAAAWPRLGPRAGRHRLQHGQAAHIVWVGRCERKRRRPAPVLSGEQHRAKAKLGDEPVEIVSTSGDIVGLRARIRIPESAEIYGDDGVMLRQPRHNISPRIPSVREPVQQNDRRPGTSDHVMRPRVIHQPPFTGKTRRRSRRLLETGRCRTRTQPAASRASVASGQPAWAQQNQRRARRTWRSAVRNNLESSSLKRNMMAARPTSHMTTLRPRVATEFGHGWTARSDLFLRRTERLRRWAGRPRAPSDSGKPSPARTRPRQWIQPARSRRGRRQCRARTLGRIWRTPGPGCPLSPRRSPPLPAQARHPAPSARMRSDYCPTAGGESPPTPGTDLRYAMAQASSADASTFSIAGRFGRFG